VRRAVRLNGDNRKESAGFVKILIAGELLGDSTEARKPIAPAILDEFEFGPPMFEHGDEQGVFAAEQPEHAWLGHGRLLGDAP
jgi:hypothetical protein